MIQATVTGIIRGPDWVPGMSEPPNGFFELIWVAPCSWLLIYDIWAISLFYSNLFSFFTIDHAFFLNVFLGIEDPCKLSVPNNNGQWPGNWDEGSASWTWLGGP